MATHINVLTTYGVTIPTGSEAESATRTKTVEINELLSDGSGEVVKAAPVNMQNHEIQVDGDGPFSLALTAATIATVSTVTITSVEISEAPNQRCRFSVRAAAVASFSDPGTAEASVGAEPTVTDLEITSVTYSVAESVRRTATLEDKVLVGTDGTPAFRATCTERLTFDIAGRGDLPAGPALGTGGAEFFGAATGVTIVGTLRESERRADWNGWGVAGTNYPHAS
jgi:hypothetical protein